MSKQIDMLEIVIKKTLPCWRNLQLSTKMVSIHDIEDHLLNKIKDMISYNRLFYLKNS